MRKEDLKALSRSELAGTIERVQLAVEDIVHCLREVREENDELSASNSMLNSAVGTLRPRISFTEKLLSFWRRPHTMQEEPKSCEDEEETKTSISVDFTDEIVLPKYYKSQSTRALPPNLRQEQRGGFSRRRSTKLLSKIPP